MGTGFTECRSFFRSHPKRIGGLMPAKKLKMVREFYR